MKISKVRVLTTLKCGNQVWVKGKLITSPIPEDILSEIRQVTGTVEVLEGSGYLDEPPEQEPRSFTADEVPKEPVKEKPKPRLLKRKLKR